MAPLMIFCPLGWSLNTIYISVFRYVRQNPQPISELCLPGISCSHHTAFKLNFFKLIDKQVFGTVIVLFRTNIITY